MSTTTDLISRTELFVQGFMSEYDASHDHTHIQRVRRLAEHIAATESHTYNAQTVTLAALLHDVGDHKYLSAGTDGKRVAADFLLSTGASAELATAVQTIVSAVSYSGETRDPDNVARALAQHPELGPVQDADRLDALGAVGIGRCFCFCGARAESAGLNAAVEHFAEKLLLLEGLMKTETGKAMAKERTRRLRMFLGWWGEEVRGEELGGAGGERSLG